MSALTGDARADYLEDIKSIVCRALDSIEELERVDEAADAFGTCRADYAMLKEDVEAVLGLLLDMINQALGDN